MDSTLRAPFLLLAVLVTALLPACKQDDASPLSPSSAPELDKAGPQLLADNPSGRGATISTNGSIDLANPFFQKLGTNGRSCGSCHLPGSGFSLSAADAQAIFGASGGADPLFASVDGANCSSVTPADGAAGHSLLLEHGLFRIGLTVPAGAEFTITAVRDPYHCALQGSPLEASVYRRPLPSTNLRFLSAVMFDGRETVQPLTSGPTFLMNLRANLTHQAMDATLGHAQASTSPSAAQLDAIVDFELALFTAQGVDNEAGVLNAQGGKGGPSSLTSATYYPGINDPLGGNPTGAAFQPNSFTIYQAWADLHGSNPYTEARAAIARGQSIFNSRPLFITNVAGLNDALGIPSIRGTCTTCHDTPNVGNHSLPVPLDIGTSRDLNYESAPEIRAALGQLNLPDLPVFQVTCTQGPLAGTVKYTSDPGRALITGHCSDVERIKGPILRGLASRAPYFHNGSAANLSQVVDFYNQRFQINLTPQEKSDLGAFLRAL